MTWSRRSELGSVPQSFGAYVSGEYQFARRWFGGVRFDYSERATDPHVTDKGGSVLLTYWPSEFSQVRGQYRRTRYGEAPRRPTSSCSSSCSRSARTARIRSREAQGSGPKAQGLAEGDSVRDRHSLSSQFSVSPLGSRILRVVASLVVAVTAAPRAAGKLNVVTTTEDLASLAREVGGDRIDVDSIAQGYQDPHFVEPKPSFILKLNKADLLIVVGPRAGDRLAAAAHHAEPQREDPAGRPTATSTPR